MAYPATPKTWVAGDVLTAAQMNAELRDALLGAFPLGPPDAAWTSFTPTLTQAATVTKTVTRAKYQRVGRLITASYELLVTGAGTAANAVIIGLPVTAVASNDNAIGSGFVFDASAVLMYQGVCVQASTTTMGMYGPATNPVGYLGQQQFAAALAVNDRVSATVTYEAAA